MPTSPVFMCAVLLLSGCGGDGSVKSASHAYMPGLPATGPAMVVTSAMRATPAQTLLAVPVGTVGRPLVAGHRGASDIAPENTLASYRAAISRQADYGETDVVETADGQLVLMHDTTLARTTNVAEVFPGRAPYNVSSFTLAEIRRLDAGKWFSPDFSGEKVPILAELLALLHDNNTGLLLELKSNEADLAAKVAAQLAASGWVKNGVVTEKLVIMSFNANHLRKMRTLLPAVQSAILVSSALTEAEIADIATYSNGISTYFPLVNAAFLDLCNKYQLTPSAWTVDSPADIDAMLSMPLGWITTNNLLYLRSRSPL